MKMSIFLTTAGIILLVISFMLRSAEISYRVKVKGNSTEYATTGAVIGGAGGAVAGSAIGGIGIAAMGTGIGIPAGLVILALAAIGGAAGRAAGKAMSTPDTYITQTSPAFSPWLWGSLMVLSFVMIIWGAVSIWAYYQEKVKNTTAN